MATQLQIRRGTTAQMNAFTGAEGELAVNTSTDTLHVHNGATAGGFALARADGSNIATYAGSFTTLAASSTATLNTLASSGATLTGGTINGMSVGATTASTGSFTTIAASGAITGNVTGNLTGSVLTAAQTNITSVGTLSSLAVTGAATVGNALIDNTGNATLNFLTYSGSQDVTANIQVGRAELSGPASVIYFQTNNGTALSTAMTITDDGNVGIGVTPSAWGANYAALQSVLGLALWTTRNTPATILGSNAYNANEASDRYVTSYWASKYTQNEGIHKWFTAPSGTAGNAISFSQSMTLDAGGALRINGTTGYFGEKFTVTSSTSYTQTSVRTGTGNEGHIVFRNANGAAGTIFTNGSATAYNTSSDYRLKENIADADDAGSKIDAIQVRKYDWKADGSHQDYGMVAQELQTVAPEAVSGDADSEEMMGVDYSKLVPMMLKEIQSLRARINALETE